VQDDWSDEALYRGLMERNPHALEVLIRHHSREITYFIRTVLERVGTPQDAEECANDLFVAVWQEIGEFDPARGSLRTWLTMRAKYIALDRRRQIQRRQATVTSLDSGGRTHTMDGQPRDRRPMEVAAGQFGLVGASMEGLIEQRERGEDLRRALEELPHLDRQLVYLRYLYFASTEEISRQTGLTHHAIDTRLWRVRKVLRAVLTEQSVDRPLDRQRNHVRDRLRDHVRDHLGEQAHERARKL
jgi:RNA polymerase sigma-70 factor (ECF subfamily)